MMDKFRIYDDAGYKMIEHLQYPRFKAKIKFGSSLSDLEEISMLDQCTDPMILARAMREAADYLLSQ